MKYERVMEALKRGESDARLLDGRDFDARYWQNARRQLSNLRRERDQLEAERDAFSAVLAHEEEK